jgi:hypothetical protein
LPVPPRPPSDRIPDQIGARITSRSHRHRQHHSYRRSRWPPAFANSCHVSRQSQARRGCRSPLPRRPAPSLPATPTLTPIRPPRLTHRSHPRVAASLGLVHFRPSTSAHLRPRDPPSAAGPRLRGAPACTGSAAAALAPPPLRRGLAEEQLFELERWEERLCDEGARV